MTFHDWLLKVRHVTGDTADIYTRWADLYRKAHGDAVSVKTSRRWLLSVAVAGKIPMHAVTALKQYCAWLIKTGTQHDAPYSLISRPNVSRKQSHCIDKSLIDRHIEKRSERPTYIQGRAAVMLMYSALVRPIDILSLSWDNVDFFSGTVRIGDVDRSIHKTALDALADWYAIAPARGPFVPVFSAGGSMLSSSYLIDLVHEVDKRITPHLVRECAIREMLKNGASIEAVANLSGLHVASIARRVGGHISPDRLRAVYMHAHEHAEAE